MPMILHFSADLVCQQNSCTPLNRTGVRKVHSVHYNSPVNTNKTVFSYTKQNICNLSLPPPSYIKLIFSWYTKLQRWNRSSNVHSCLLGKQLLQTFFFFFFNIYPLFPLRLNLWLMTKCVVGVALRSSHVNMKYEWIETIILLMR